MTAKRTTEDRVREAMAEGHAYPKQIASAAALTVRQVQIAISKLQRSGAVVRHGLGYRLANEADPLHVEPNREAG